MKDFFNGVRRHIGKMDAEHLREQYARLSDEAAFLDTLFQTIAQGIIVLDENGAPKDKLMCPTGIHQGNAEMMEGKAWRSRLVENGGHVVIKAYDVGKKYKVYYLTDDDESMNVKLVFGPFDSKGAQA